MHGQNHIKIGYVVLK